LCDQQVNGTGLGLALVAKLIGDHGGTIEFDSQPRRTVFKVSLPMYDDSKYDEPKLAGESKISDAGLQSKGGRGTR
ncbi:ATP-binding protein, partial [Azospirillum sp. B506]|uniref:ATP-binding protein n=1 Tax=Azospirillum sp. B506 TaxID=137721 RepID=UPI0005B2705B